MGNESKDNINLSELLLKISTDVAEIKSDMSNFKENYKSEKESLLEKIQDVRSDCERELARQSAELKQLNVYIEAVRTQKDKDDAKKWRVVIAFICTGIGGMLLARLPDFLLFIAQNMMNGGK